MEKKQIERRFEIRASQGDEFSLVGRALTYKEVSSNELAPGIRERIMPGCFTKSLASGRDVKCTFNHDGMAIPLGRLANGSLELDDNSDFLSFRCKLTRGISDHEDVYHAVKSGLISECSFAFVPEDEDMSDDEYNGVRCKVRQIRSALLLDVACVGEPFYGAGATAVAARNADEAHRAEVQRRLDAAMATGGGLTWEQLKAKAERLAKTL